MTGGIIEVQIEEANRQLEINLTDGLKENSITVRLDLNYRNLDGPFLEHFGHHFPCFMLSGLAFHLCPIEHIHSKLVLPLIYSEDRHFPFLFSAI